MDESGKTIDISKMEDGKPVKIRKNPDSTVGAVAFDKPQTLTSLEGNLNDVDFARTYTMLNISFMKNILDRQMDINPSITELIIKILS